MAGTQGSLFPRSAIKEGGRHDAHALVRRMPKVHPGKLRKPPPNLYAENTPPENLYANTPGN